MMLLSIVSYILELLIFFSSYSFANLNVLPTIILLFIYALVEYKLAIISKQTINNIYKEIIKQFIFPVIALFLFPYYSIAIVFAMISVVKSARLIIQFYLN